MSSEARNSQVTFFSKTPISCPVCDANFYREEMRTGRGRLIAGKLTQELRRTYEPSQKYGEVFPLVYPVTVCPACYYAAYPQDFAQIPPTAQERIKAETEKRIEGIHTLFTDLDFTTPRRLQEGLASYFFAISCYDFFPKEFSPTYKQGLSSLRAAWIASDLHKKNFSENYDYLARVFYRKARFFYTLSIEKEQRGEESIPNNFHLGPDLDKNYGYDGVLYITGLLEYRYGPRKDRKKRQQALERAKRTVARIFGMGRASRDKPAAILDNARDVYEEIGKELGLENLDPELDDELT